MKKMFRGLRKLSLRSNPHGQEKKLLRPSVQQIVSTGIEQIAQPNFSKDDFNEIKKDCLKQNEQLYASLRDQESSKVIDQPMTKNKRTQLNQTKADIEKNKLLKDLKSQEYAAKRAATKYNTSKMEQSETETRNQTSQNQNSPLKNRSLYIVIACLIGTVETPVSYKLMEGLLSLPPVSMATACIGIVFLVGIGAHFTAKGILEKNWLSIILGTITITAPLLLQSTLRLFSPEITHKLLLLISLGFAVANFLLSYWHLRSRCNFATYISQNEQEDLICVTRAAIDNKTQNQLLIDKEYELKTEKEDIDAWNKYNIEKQDQAARIAALTTEEQESKTSIIASLNNAYYKKHTNYADIFTIPTVANSITLFIGISITTLLASGCNNPSFRGNNTTLSHSVSNAVFDKTNSNKGLAEINSEETSNWIINNVFHLNDEDSIYNSCTLNISVITTSSRPIISSLTLPSGNPNPLFRIKKDRLELVKQFTADIHTLIDSVSKLPANATSTNWSLAQCYFLKELNKIDNNYSKTLLLFGDGYDDNSRISFSSYKSDQQFNLDFKNIAQQLDSVCNPGDLSGIDIYLIGSPINPNASVKPESVINFWEYYLATLHHANFQVLGNLY